MSLFKMKRGQESKVSSLTKEDGSLIFSLNGANNSTVRLDQTVNGTVQRLGIAVDKAKDADGVIDYNEPTRHIKIGYAGAGLSTSNLNYIAGYTNNGTQIKNVSKDVLKNWLGTMGSADSAKVIEPFENATANASRNVWFSDSGKRNKPVYNDNFKYNPVSQILTTNISGSAAKWATARTVTLNGDLSGSFSIDGSGNVSANIYDYYSTVYVDNTNNYPYHRIAKLDTISSSYVDKSTLLYLSQGYQGGRFGIIRVTLRTNNVSGGAKSGVEARWLIRSGFNIDDIKIGHYSVAGKTYADVFYRSNSAYAGCVIRDLGSGSRGNIGRCWTLVNSKEAENTTTSDKKTSFECWATIELAGKDLHNQAYSEIISSSDGGTVAYANNSGALGGSSLSQVLASAGGGNAFTAIDTATNNVVKLTRANGGTVQKTIDNVSHATSATIATSAVSVQTFPSTLTLGSGGPAIIDQDSATYRQRIRIEDNGTSGDNVFIFQQSSDSGVSYKDLFRILDNGSVVASTFTGYLNGNAKNSNALGGSSLSQILAQSGSGNAFTGLDTTTNNVIKLTRANGGTVQKTINNVANATSATIATSANRINPTLSLTGGDGNTSGYRLIATISIAAWGNYRGVFTVKSRHTGGGILTVSVGCNTSPVSQSNGYFEIKYWGPTSSGSIISSDSWQGYISSDGTKGYLFWKYSDYNTCYVTQLSSDFLLSNGTWMTSIPTSYGVRKSLTSINYASDSNALGGSSLQNILDKINSTSGSGNAFTAIDTATNNVIKLTRANGGTVQKTVNNVSNASSASFASTATLTAYPQGFDSRTTSATWGNTTGTFLTGWHTSSGGDVAFMNNNPSSGKVSMKLDGYFYQNEGTNRVLDTSDAANYVKKAGDTMTGLLTLKIGSQQGVKLGSAWMTAASSTNGEFVFQNGHLRFGASDWNYDRWAGLKYDAENKYVYLGIADGTIFTANNPQNDGLLFTPGISGIYIGGTTTTRVATSSDLSSYVAKSGDTMTGTLKVNAPIFGYRYGSNNDSPAFVFDKPGNYYTGIGAHGTDTIYFSAVNISGLTWNNDYKQKWIFNGSVSATTVTADYFDGTIANATSAENASHLGGKVASDYALKTDLSGNINALSAKRLPSYQSVSVDNSFFYRYGTAGNTSDGGAWTGFPSTTLYSGASTANGFGNALFQKKVGVLHLAAGSSAHDLVFQAGGTNGGIAYVATGRNPAYILDTLNYKDKAYTFNKLTAASTFTATSGVVIDGGSY